jgi:hypothetical protein
MGKGEWQAVRGNSLVASVQHGVWDYFYEYTGYAPGKFATTDIGTLQQGGMHVSREVSRSTFGITPRVS